jgi:choline-sulfatase
MDQPDILLIQADQLAAGALGAYGNRVVSAPHLDALADESVVFDRAYCNSPLCAPSRASMLTGELPSTIGAYDNAAELPAAVPTFAHHLRVAGYRTTLVGKTHFIGPDQLHGFEERLTTDVYPADFEMVPNWRLADDERLPWYHDTRSIGGAEPSAATLQRDYDDEVAFQTRRALTDIARARVHGDRRPFLLMTSFIAPHDPYEPPQEHWDRYEDVEIDLPGAPPADDAHSRRLRAMCELDTDPPAEDEIRRARRGYYGCVSYLDDQIGAVLDTLAKLGLAEDTLVVFTSDHGDMLGEHGLWYKMSPFDGSARVPLIVRCPGRFAPGRVGRTVSLVDLLPTFTEVAGVDAPPAAGTSLVGLLEGRRSDWPNHAVIEYLAEGVRAPQLTFVKGRWKLIHCPGDADLLFDLDTDPDEVDDRAADPDLTPLVTALRDDLLAGRHLDALSASILESQQERRLVHQALTTGRVTSWDHPPRDRSAEQYVRHDFWTSIQRGRLAMSPTDLSQQPD